jgi:hypothetical protein
MENSEGHIQEKDYATELADKLRKCMKILYIKILTSNFAGAKIVLLRINLAPSATQLLVFRKKSF